MIPIIITGAGGRMGKTLVTAASLSEKFRVVGATERSDSSFIGKDAGVVAGLDPLSVIIRGDLAQIFSDFADKVDKKVRRGKISPIIIDFTHPDATLGHLAQAAHRKIPMVIGTTGFSPVQQKAVHQFSQKIPIVVSPNMSVGVNVLFKLVSQAAQILAGDYDMEIFEAHHRLKKDAPSGTAVKLAELLALESEINYPKDFVFHRQGMIGERRSKEIGIQVLRGGDIVGEHTVFFCGNGERLEIKHVATNRHTFAEGALRAAAWVSGKKQGLYDMGSVLEL